MSQNQSLSALLPTVLLLGSVNAGKSSLLNALIGQVSALVSEQEGTTTDALRKRYELIGSGPVIFIDSAGLADSSSLGQQRMQRTADLIATADLIIQVIKAPTQPLGDLKAHFLPDRLVVFSHCDQLTPQQRDQLTQLYPSAILTSINDPSSMDLLRKRLSTWLASRNSDPLLLSGLSLSYPNVVHVTPIDSEAPKGRLILPQMQLIRECLDLHYQSVVLQPSELANYLADNPKVGLIVTDSQAFAKVSAINQQRHPLTSYSILQARHKGDLAFFLQGLAALAQLPAHSTILMMESCAHNTSHEDIGRVKIPALIAKLYADKHFTLEFAMGSSMPKLDKYHAVIHCGSCMLSRQVMQGRINQAKQQQVPMLNYGLFLAHAMGILAEATALFAHELQDQHLLEG